MARRNHRRRRQLGWQQRQQQNTRILRQEHGNTLIDRAMGRPWSTSHQELLAIAQARSTPTNHWYVWRRPGSDWRLGNYTVEAHQDNRLF